MRNQTREKGKKINLISPGQLRGGGGGGGRTGIMSCARHMEEAAQRENMSQQPHQLSDSFSSSPMAGPRYLSVHQVQALNPVSP